MSSRSRSERQRDSVWFGLSLIIVIALSLYCAERAASWASSSEVYGWRGVIISIVVFVAVSSSLWMVSDLMYEYLTGRYSDLPGPVVAESFPPSILRPLNTLLKQAFALGRHRRERLIQGRGS